LTVTPAKGNPQLCAMGETMVRAFRDVLSVPGIGVLIGASAASQIGS
jgi:hypothetical protein